MRQYGKVETRFWSDRKIRDLSERGRILFLYLLTCPHSSPIGCFRLPPEYIVSDLMWKIETVNEVLIEIILKELVEYDYDRQILWLKNFFKHNSIDNPNVGKFCIPFIESIDKASPIFAKVILSLEPFANRFPKGYLNRLANGMPNINLPNPNHNQNNHNHPDNAATTNTEQEAKSVSPPFGIINVISDEGLACAKAAAEGWDIYYLAKIYNEWVKEQGLPNNPDAAFPAWCKKYTKGKPP